MGIFVGDFTGGSVGELKRINAGRFLGLLLVHCLVWVNKWDLWQAIQWENCWENPWGHQLDCLESHLVRPQAQKQGQQKEHHQDFDELGFPSKNLVFWLGNCWGNWKVMMWVNSLRCNVTEVWVTLVFVPLESNHT